MTSYGEIVEDGPHECAHCANRGTYFNQPATGTVFPQILIEPELVADASADPSDTPDTPLLRVQVDAAGKVYLFAYTTEGGWTGVQMGALA